MPPFEFRLYRGRQPDGSVAAFGLRLNFNAVGDAAVDAQAVLFLVVPARRCGEVMRGGKRRWNLTTNRSA